MRLLKSQIVLRLANSYLIDSPQPSNISYVWNFGSLLGLCLILQILTGIFLAMHYTPNIELAFNSVEHTKRASAILILIIFPCAYFLFKVNTFVLRSKYGLQNVSQLFNLIKKFKHTYSNIFSGLIPVSAEALKLIIKDSLNKFSTCVISTKESHETEESFYEWFRGLTDGEGCFEIISPAKGASKFYFRFSINMHKDESSMLNYVCSRLKFGKVFEREHFTTFYVISDDIPKIIEIFDKYPLNTSKHLNYLAFKEGYLLYNNNKETKKILNIIFSLKESMNKKRINFELPSNHFIKITPYWLLGFVEAEGYFSVASTGYYRLEFGIGQTLTELPVLEAIKNFLLNLPGGYTITRVDTNPVGLNIDKKPKNEKSKPMVKIQVYKTDYIKNVLIPFFDNLNWLSKKKLDYIDWKLILTIKTQGKHFTEQGKEVIYLISKRMNRYRLSTNRVLQIISKNTLEAVQHKILNVLKEASNYEIHPNGKVWVKSIGAYLKGRGNIKIEALDDKGLLFYSFNSIKDCASFFRVSERTINRRLDNSKPFLFANADGSDGYKITIRRAMLEP